MRILLALTTLLFTVASIAQVDFNNYTTLSASGKIPDDFSLQTHQKLAQDLENDRNELSKNDEAQFLEMIHYGLDNVLHSGLVVYGDPISNYVTDVAKHLLKDEKELLSKLRFYTIKSNVANAFSTDQGIVFITTGLISQFSNEAQLAYVLAHEISHYTEKHVVQTFDWNLKNHNHHDYFDQMSTYSKDKEFAADKIAVELCHKAGYSDDEIYGSFDVLMYSYLPFDEIELPKTYFNTPNLFIPETLFPAEKYEIKAEEDYDDSYSTHPNVKRRKDTVTVALNQFDNWGKASAIISADEFLKVRNIARFENVRSDIIDGAYASALYSIFLLEKGFPTSTYLSKMKAHAWLGLLSFKDNNKLSDAVHSTSDLEGEGATMHYFIKKLNKKAMSTIALRELHDIKNMHPEDKEIDILYSKTVEKLASMTEFKKEEYSSKTFDFAAREFIAKQDSIKNDTLKVVTEEPAEKSTKYQRIKKKKDPNTIEGFDSTKFYIYGISDILLDSTFNQRYNLYKLNDELKKADEDALNKLSYSERKKVLAKRQSDESKLGLTEIVVVEPTVVSYTRRGVDNVKSEELESDLSDAIDYASQDVGTTIYHIDKRTLANGGTDAYNERSTIMTLLNQILVSEEEETGVLPIDYSLLQEVQSHYGSSKVMFTLVEHYRKPRISPGGVVGMVFLPPVLPLYLVRGFFAANQTELTFIVLDTEKGTVELANTYYLNSPVKKWYLRSQMYNIFKEINSKPQ